MLQILLHEPGQLSRVNVTLHIIHFPFLTCFLGFTVGMQDASLEQGEGQMENNLT